MTCSRSWEAVVRNHREKQLCVSDTLPRQRSQAWLYWDDERSQNNCLASTFRWSNLTGVGYDLGLFLKLLGWLQCAAKFENTGIRVEIRITLDGLLNVIMPPVLPQLIKSCESERVCWGRGNGMRVVRDIYFEKSCISDSYKAHQPTEKNALLPHNKHFFKTIPKSQLALLIFSVNLYFTNQ